MSNDEGRKKVLVRQVGFGNVEHSKSTFAKANVEEGECGKMKTIKSTGHIFLILHSYGEKPCAEGQGKSACG
jgi:hypothetical protein